MEPLEKAYLQIISAGCHANKCDDAIKSNKQAISDETAGQLLNWQKGSIQFLFCWQI